MFVDVMAKIGLRCMGARNQHFLNVRKCVADFSEELVFRADLTAMLASVVAVGSDLLHLADAESRCNTCAW